MVLGFVIVLSIVGIGLALIMYANLLPFISTLGDIKEYNMAYYGAHSALERSFLVLRQRDAWFDGRSGMTGSSFVWPASDDLAWSQFLDRSDTTLARHIMGRGDTIPGTWLGTIERHLVSGSNDAHILPYNQSHTIALRYDAASLSDAYRSDIDVIRSLSGSWIGLQLAFSLNETLKDLFLTQWGVGAADLDTASDYDGDATSDDIAVDRWRLWSYTNVDTLATWSFSILPRSVVAYSSWWVGTVITNDDESIRESVINTPPGNGLSWRISHTINQWWFNPLATVLSPTAVTHRLISDEQSLSGVSFIDMLAWGTNDYSFYKQSLTISLLSPLLTSIGTLYPFVEYRVVCEWCDSGVSLTGPQIAQPYFLIDATSTVGDYTVTMQVQRSISDEVLVSQFAVIF